MIDYAAAYTAIVAWARAAIIANGGATGSPSLLRVIQANQENVKPAIPFATVLLSTTGEMEGSTAIVSGNAQGITATRYEVGTLSIQGYGIDTRRWLAALLVSLDLPELTLGLSAAGLDLSELGSISDLSGLLDTTNAPRYSLDLRVRYAVTSGRSDGPALVYAQIDPLTLALYEGDPDPLIDGVQLPDPPPPPPPP